MTKTILSLIAIFLLPFMMVFTLISPWIDLCTSLFYSKPFIFNFNTTYRCPPYIYPETPLCIVKIYCYIWHLINIVSGGLALIVNLIFIQPFRTTQNLNIDKEHKHPSPSYVYPLKTASHIVNTKRSLNGIIKVKAPVCTATDKEISSAWKATLARRFGKH